MNNILITSAGSPAAVGLIKSIRELKGKYNIVAVDSDPLAAGLFLADINLVIPPT